MSSCNQNILSQENPHDLAITTNCNIFKIHNLQFHCKQSTRSLIAEPSNSHHFIFLKVFFFYPIILNSVHHSIGLKVRKVRLLPISPQPKHVGKFPSQAKHQKSIQDRLLSENRKHLKFCESVKYLKALTVELHTVSHPWLKHKL